MILLDKLREALRRKDKNAEPEVESEKPKQARPQPFDHEYYRDDRVGAPGTITVSVGGPKNQRLKPSDFDW